MTRYQHSQQKGLHIATAEMPHMESVSLALYIPVGSRHESLDFHGSAHFIEHMIFKGTSRRNVRELTIEIEGNGGTINAYTTEDLTCIEARGPAELLDLFSDILCDMAWHSSFPVEEITREREVIEEEITMYYENPGEHIEDLLSKALWKNHPLGRPITGTHSSLAALQRPELLDFHREHYFQSGAILAAAGAVSHQQVLASIARTQCPQLSGTRQCAEPFTRPQGTQIATAADIQTEYRKLDQAHLALGFYCEGEHSSQRHSLRILSLILGETMSSRLFQEVREKRGLCYNIQSDYELFEDVGSLQIHAGMDATRLPEALDAIQNVLTDIAQNGISQQELDQAIRYATAQHRISLEGTEAQMAWIGESILTHKTIVPPRDARDILRQVSRADVLQTAQTILKSNNQVTACIGPIEHAKFQDMVPS